MKFERGSHSYEPSFSRFLLSSSPNTADCNFSSWMLRHNNNHKRGRSSVLHLLPSVKCMSWWASGGSKRWCLLLLSHRPWSGRFLPSNYSIFRDLPVGFLIAAPAESEAPVSSLRLAALGVTFGHQRIMWADVAQFALKVCDSNQKRPPPVWFGIYWTWQK